MEWMAFWKEEPFGDEWRKIARICTVLQHIHAGKGRRLDEDEFIPGKGKSQQSPEQLGEFLKSLAKSAE